MPSNKRSSGPIRRLDHSAATNSGTMSHPLIEDNLNKLATKVAQSSATRYEAAVTGPVFVGTHVVPSLLVPENSGAKSVYARLGVNPTGATVTNVVVELEYDGTVVATLTITPTAVNGFSNTVDGSAIPAFEKNHLLDVNVTSVGDITPGTDLTVYIEV